MTRGAKPGERRGGRSKGTSNKKTDKQVRAVKETGVTPLEYLLAVMRNDVGDPGERIDAAKAAAPYVHARLSAMEINATLGMSHEDALSELE